MYRNATLVTRFVSFNMAAHRPVRLQLSGEQEVVREDPPTPLDNGRIQRFVYVHGPSDAPIFLNHRELLPDGSLIWVRREPDVDVPMQ